MDLFSMLGIPKESLEEVQKLIPEFGEKLSNMEVIAERATVALERQIILLECIAQTLQSISGRQLISPPEYIPVINDNKIIGFKEKSNG